MPIRPELRHFYGPEWRNVIRPRILERAGNRCERCGAPNRTVVLRTFGWWTPATVEATVFKNGGRWHGRPVIELPWTAPTGGPAQLAGFLPAPCHWVGIVICVAHLNHTPGDDRDENLIALCQWDHIQHDKTKHAIAARETRIARKDSERPLLQLAGSPHAESVLRDRAN